MRILLDTNIIIHREASTVIRKEIGILFNWLDRLRYVKCIHPITIREIRQHRDPKVVESFNIKLQSYVELKTEAPESAAIARIRVSDVNQNDINDTSIVKEVFEKRVAFLITEDRQIHAKAKALAIGDRVLTIDDFLEKVTAEHPSLSDYKVLSVKKELFGSLNVGDIFFDSFRRDYPEFDAWFNRKSDEMAYVCKSDRNELLAFLYVKIEDEREPYSDIRPAFTPKKRLKIGTFKVVMNGFKLGERFLKIVFDNAIKQSVHEVYVTIFNNDSEQERLIKMLSDWGFRALGTKTTPAGIEKVLVRDFTPRADTAHPVLTYPYVSKARRKFIVSIYPKYHTELLPDSILRTELPDDFIENRPNRNAIRKVFISRSIRRDMESGDIVIFYRTQDKGAAHYTSVATTVGVIDSVVTPVASLDDFVRLCRNRSVFSDAELKEHWDWNPRLRPFVVNFLYVYSLPKRPNFASLKEQGIITAAPRGFDEITDLAFNKLIQISNADDCFIVD